MGSTNIESDTWNPVVCDEPALTIPLHWQKARTIFVCSMSDLFHKDVPVEFTLKVFGVMIATPWHTYILLTKRPNIADAFYTWWMDEATKERWFDLQPAMALHAIEKLPTKLSLANTYYLDHCDQSRRGLSSPAPWPLPHILLGTSCENQATADERIPHLLRCPAAGRFVSFEPLLGPINLPQPARYTPDADLYGMGRYTIQGLQNIIIGGESGPGARPCEIKWIRSLIKQAKAAGVSCFAKQTGSNVIGEVRECCGERWLNGSREGDGHICRKCGDLAGCGVLQFKPKHSKGGDPSEWPADLRVQELPAKKPSDSP